jgi:antitoxin (DNA-binding transcriptional repressor) of toxin-antitoxin stability system
MDRGAKGDEVVVTRHGRAAVRLLPLQPRLTVGGHDIPM